MMIKIILHILHIFHEATSSHQAHHTHVLHIAHGLHATLSALMLLLFPCALSAQISIGGNVYGGGNEGNLGGKTSVTIRQADIDGSVFGGARQANVGGSTFVNIDGNHMSGDILINYVYGGNDIAGTIGASATIPDELTEAIANGITDDTGDSNGKNKLNKKSYNAFVLTTKERTVTENAVTTQPYKMYIGQLYGGGNGDYDYTSHKQTVTETDPDTGEEIPKVVETNPYYGVTMPELGKTYIEMRGGSCVILYGGGNNVTVTEATDICIDNPSEVTNHIYERNDNGDEIADDAHDKLQDNDRLKRMGCYALGGATGATGYVTSDAYQFSRVFGGNNKAAMAIRPKWHLKQGKIRNLFSGGNRGAMTYENGIFLSIKEDANPDPDTGFMGLIVGNVYGGCRMADVNPDKHTIYEETIEGVLCPAGYAARLNIAGGTIGNVYGGNDISGTVYGGNAVGIHSSVNGDVYGGGNGSYPYTDNTAFEHKDGVEDTEAVSLYGDYFYNVKKELNLNANATFTGLQSAQVLNEIRPHAEKVTVRLISDDPDKPTIIGGSVYCGGNSATLRSSSGSATAELKIGSYVYADKVFLGSNGENMVTEDVLKQLAGNVTVEGTEYDFNQIDLTVQAQMDEYMKGCEMGVRPSVVFDKESDGGGGYVPHSTYFGSFYCGGNVGSVNVPGMNTLNFNQNFVIFDKLVGGCNNAYVPVKYDGTTALNAAFDGGLIAAPDATTKNKLTMNLSNVKIQPMRWKDENDKTQLLEWNTVTNGQYTPVTNGTTLTQGHTYYTSAEGAGTFTAVGTEVADGSNYYEYVTTGTYSNTGIGSGTGTATEEDLARRFTGGNVYGGCCESGHINGNVIINIDHTLMDPNELFDEITEDDNSLYGQDILTKDSYTIKTRRTGVILGEQGMDVLGTALNIYGGGKGKSTEIWGSTTINHNGGYVFQIFGGSEEGVIGKGEACEYLSEKEKSYENGYYYFNGKKYTYNADYSCTVNMKGAYDGVPKSATADVDMSDCEFIYGGGFLGPICGNTIVNLGKGRIFNSFAGSCNADILGHTETYTGRQINSDGTNGEGFPYVRDYIYGGNDMGGRILGTADFSSRVRTASTMLHSTDMPKNVSSYVEYTQGHAIGIFGGCFGTYDYTDPEYKDFFYTTGSDGQTSTNLGTARPGFTKPRMEKAFVNIRPTATNDLKSKTTNTISEVYGAGQGYPGDADRDIMQKSSYILIDIPQDMTNYTSMEVWGAGAWSGLGMENHVAPGTTGAAADTVSAVIDLPRGQIAAAYGGSYQEGVTRRTVINVPAGSTLQVGSIFGGAYGTNTYMPCDVYEANVNWNSEDAVLICDTVRIDEETKQKVGDNRMKGAIYGGNNNERRTLYGKVNINVPMKQRSWKYGMTLGTVYGAGCGGNTWAEYTEVNLEDGAQVYEVYGGGQAGKVHNAESVQYYMDLATPDYTWPEGYARAGEKLTDAEWVAAWRLGGGYDPPAGTDPNTNQPYTYWENTNTNLANPLARTAEMDDRDFSDLHPEDLALVQNKYSTNVIIKKGATVVNYAYGGGLGADAVVAGTTYVALLGGTVKKDIYAAGTSGAVQDLHGADSYSSGNRAGFMASANAFIAGGTCRNVYGGGWKGSVGRHNKIKTKAGGGYETDSHGNYVVLNEDADIYDPAIADIDGETHVVIGIRKDQATLPANYGFYNGVPTIQRNAYGGGEGGAVYGTAYLTLNNGYIGYEYVVPDGSTVGTYEEKINDETYYENETYAGDNRLRDCGNVFGGGYDARSSVDESNIKIWGGLIRGSLHGGGEIATIGRGSTKESGEVNSVREFNKIYRAGKTHIEMYNGHVKRNVFGGGKGYNLLGYGSNSGLYTDGYTFGQTEVFIHGGEIGTEEGLADGYGNVFGGGDVGYVYSKGYSNPQSRTTGTGSPNHNYYYTTPYKCNTAYGKYKVNDIIDEIIYNAMSSDEQDNWTAQATSLIEDCKVVVTPYLQVKGDGTKVTYNNKDYYAYDYVPTDYLNTLPKDKENSKWANLILKEGSDERGVLIHNGVFGGGNVSSNSDTHYANATTVYGNTTATLCDVYHRDFITVGTEHTGGIYGGGNLSVVDGYRELNITNYGTDYYNMDSRVSLEDYHNKLTNRERAYFKLEYECQTEYTGTAKHYSVGEKISEDDYNSLPEGEKTNWAQYGFCSIYAGRLLNTIQRADFCGVFGSRMVLQGAKDRVADVGEKIDYTINRVGELSLNKQNTMAGDTNAKDATHGNYFGIYSIVNYLGNLTSDVRMRDTYIDEKGNPKEGKTFYSYKEPQPQGNWRNKGTSLNEVALASGVFLELTTENSTADHKDYGYITGVVQLDLINVKREIQGGGFVYAKNEHRIPKFYANKANVILSDFNKLHTAHEAAKTYKRYRYSATYDNGQSNEAEWADAGDYYVIDNEEAYALKEIQTSGNFIHQSKRIVDDCYPINNAYTLNVDPYSEAHYWYIKGSVYIYDQVVSAYTGSANAYSKVVHLPLTITAASHGKLKLLNVKPNRYAYYSNPAVYEKIGTGSSAQDKKVWVNKQADGYELNDVITWWDWQNLPLSEQACFVEDTYVNAEACIINGTKYAVGEYVILPDDYDELNTNTTTITDAAGHAFEDKEGNTLTGTDLKKYVFRSSNNISNNSGYVLTLDMNTPEEWDGYYTKKEPTGAASDKITTEEYKALTDDEKLAYLDAPTFTPNSTEAGYYVLGKRQYTAGQVITEADYNFAVESADGNNNMEKAYVATTTVSYTYGGTTKTTNAGTAIGQTEYNALSSDKQSAFAEAWVCTNTLKLGNDNYLLNGDLKTAAEITAMKSITPELVTDAEIDAALSPAYICTVTGLYGGRKYVVNKNYTALESFSDLSAADRAFLTYNYDALDLLVDPYYLVDPEANESDATSTKTIYHEPYSKTLGVQYDAVFKGYSENNDNPYTYDDLSVAKGASITSDVFETKVPNYKRFYSKVTQSDIYDDTENSKKYFYISTTNFIYDGEPYGIGQIVSKDVYQHNEAKVNQVETTQNNIFYYCYEEHAEGSSTVTVGTVITEDAFKLLRNDQQYFVIQGQEPTETTTFYVNRESDIKDVTKEKVITVIYQYTYYEQDDDEEDGGGAIKMTNELHVLNIHLQLESGAPSIGILENPPTVLPGNAVGMKNPTVTPGTYEVLTNGYELFDNKTDAEYHRNGVEFKNNSTPVYWYQNRDHYIAFYSKTYLGKTYSNYVPLSVANYHDLADIMERHKDNHLYIDREDVDRPCKIYINDYSNLPETDARKGKNGLDELKDLFALSTGTDLTGHTPLNNYINGCENLEIYLRTDIEHTDTWTSIGESTCFGGNIHGDGHTLKGLSSSLFNRLCGNVYNLGVMGSFTGAGIAETGEGFVENCWVSTTGTPASGTKAVFGNPSRTDGTQLVNCYYPESNAYSEVNHARGNARKMPDKAFYDGTVAYNLNGYYLGKRYYDHTTPSGTTSSYDFITAQADGTLPVNAQTGMATTSEAYYPTIYAYYTPQHTTLTPKLGYVEHRFYDGDFRYAGGNIPETFNIRRQENEVTVNNDQVTDITWVPIWPDDYLFFGQTLTYGHVAEREHQSVPSVINKSDDRLITSALANRVFRAPAYFRNSQMQAVHFNPAAVFTNVSSDGNTEVHKNMTAIDFTGGNGDLAAGYQKENITAAPYTYITGGAFYPPLLDDDGLTAFQNIGLTKNLLAYTFAKGGTGTGETPTATQKTANVVSTALHDYAYAETHDTYHTVAPWDRSSYWSNMHGHWVQLSGSSYVAPNDHYLVDAQDFNAPIAYTFWTGKRMWYQRTPDNYVETTWSGTPATRTTMGWQDISLPFKVEIVTTQQKGELTHFYNAGSNSNYGNKGHEYWLRQFEGGSESGDVFKANLNYPAANSEDGMKQYTNTFLWDYYYSYNNYDDANADDYQENDETKTYYKDTREYENYPRMVSGTPYLIGFPGSQFYEFDLSGQFEAQNTASQPVKLSQQIITFASDTEASISVSDTEMANASVQNGYIFRPNYLNEEIAAGSNAYTLKADGSQYDKVPETGDATGIRAFRPYFVKPTSNGAPPRRRIVFATDVPEMQVQEKPQENIDAVGSLTYGTRHMTIIVSSTLEVDTPIHIVSISGQSIAKFVIKPGETIETTVMPGIYIVNKTKLIVR